MSGQTCWVVAGFSGSKGECWGKTAVVVEKAEPDGPRWSVFACEGHRQYEYEHYIEKPAVIALAELGRTGSMTPSEARDWKLTPLEAQISTWQQKIPQFAGATRGDCVRNLNEEVGELAKAAIDGEGDEAFFKEAADLYITLVGMMALEGQSLEEWVHRKMVRNEARVEFIISKLSARKRGQE